MLTPDQEKLKEAALAATPGPWSWWTSNSHIRLTGADGRDGGVLCGTANRGLGDIACSDQNRAYIERANPAAILAILAQLEQVQGWVSVKDRLPEPKQQVLMIAVGIGPRKDYTTDSYAGWRVQGTDWARWPHPFAPTHWMKSPPPPEAA